MPFLRLNSQNRRFPQTELSHFVQFTQGNECGIFAKNHCNKGFYMVYWNGNKAEICHFALFDFRLAKECDFAVSAKMVKIFMEE